MQQKLIILSFFLTSFLSNNLIGQKEMQAGRIVDPVIVFEYAIYFSENSKVDKKQAIELIQQKYKFLLLDFSVLMNYFLLKI